MASIAASPTSSAFDEDAFRKKIPYKNEGQDKDRFEIYEAIVPALKARSRSDKPRILVITDVEQDYDDLLAIIFLSEMHHLGAAELVGLIANHGVPLERAKFLRTVMHLLGLGHVEVTQGTIGIEKWSQKNYHTGYYELKNKTFANQSWNDEPFRTGRELLDDLVKEVDEGKEPLTVLLISSLQDISDYLRAHQDNPQFLKTHFKKFVSQGGYKVTDNADGTCTIEPEEKNQNNESHWSAAQHYTKCLAEYGLPSDAWSREAAKAATLEGSTFAKLAQYGPIGAHLSWLHERQEFKFYWDPFNAPFLPRLDKEWYLQTRCVLSPESKRYEEFMHSPPSFRQVLPLTRVIAYDGCAAMGAVGDDIMRALGIMGDSIPIPDYNTKAHKHRMFGLKTGDLGGVNGPRLGNTFGAFLIGALRRTQEDAEALIPSSTVEHEQVSYPVDLEVFDLQIPFLKQAGELLQASKGNQEIQDRLARLRAEQFEHKGPDGKNHSYPKVPAPQDIPYELLYQEAKRQGKEEVQAEKAEAQRNAQSQKRRPTSRKGRGRASRMALRRNKRR